MIIIATWSPPTFQELPTPLSTTTSRRAVRGCTSLPVPCRAVFYPKAAEDGSLSVSVPLSSMQREGDIFKALYTFECFISCFKDPLQIVFDLEDPDLEADIYFGEYADGKQTYKFEWTLTDLNMFEFLQTLKRGYNKDLKRYIRSLV